MAPKKKALSAAHKKAMAAGRSEGRVVRAYLEWLKSNRPRRGRKRTVETVKRQMNEVKAKLSSSSSLDPAEELRLVQRMMDLEAELSTKPKTKDVNKLEASFIKVAKSYSTRHGITRAAWRKVGVPPEILKRAGIK